MTALRVFLARVRALFIRKMSERELDAEVRAHLDLLAEEHMRKGMSPEEARYAARKQLGGVEQTKEIYRHQRRLPVIETMLQDLRFGFRMLRRSPGFTVLVILCLTLGIRSPSDHCGLARDGLPMLETLSQGT
jgi:putative ABC transport system permease protein